MSISVPPSGSGSSYTPPSFNSIEPAVQFELQNFDNFEVIEHKDVARILADNENDAFGLISTNRQAGYFRIGSTNYGAVINDNGVLRRLSVIDSLWRLMTVGGEEYVTPLDAKGALLDTLLLNTDQDFTESDLKIGETFWDSENRHPVTRFSDNVFYDHGHDLLLRARNMSGVALKDGDPCWITGAQGDKIIVGLAFACDDPQTFCQIYIATEPIAVNEWGELCKFGTVGNIADPTSIFVAGDPVYLGTNAGQLTPTAPAKNISQVVIGRVQSVIGSGAGRKIRIFVDVRIHSFIYELAGLLFDKSTALNGDLLGWDGTKITNAWNINNYLDKVTTTAQTVAGAVGFAVLTTSAGFRTSIAQGTNIADLTRKDYVDGLISGLSSTYLDKVTTTDQTVASRVDSSGYFTAVRAGFGDNATAQSLAASQTIFSIDERNAYTRYYDGNDYIAYAGFIGGNDFVFHMSPTLNTNARFRFSRQLQIENSEEVEQVRIGYNRSQLNSFGLYYGTTKQLDFSMISSTESNIKAIGGPINIESTNAVVRINPNSSTDSTFLSFIGNVSGEIGLYAFDSARAKLRVGGNSTDTAFPFVLIDPPNSKVVINSPVALEVSNDLNVGGRINRYPAFSLSRLTTNLDVDSIAFCYPYKTGVTAIKGSFRAIEQINAGVVLLYITGNPLGLQQSLPYFFIASAMDISINGLVSPVVGYCHLGCYIWLENINGVPSTFISATLNINSQSSRPASERYYFDATIGTP